MSRILKLIMLAAIASVLSCGLASAQSQEQKTPSPEEYATKEAERLEGLLDLEGWQSFYVDSTLQYNYVQMQEEIDEMRSSKVDNYNLYLAVQDKWLDRTDSSFQKFFTPEQWTKYLKSGAAKQQKARAKRAEKRK